MYKYFPVMHLDNFHTTLVFGSQILTIINTSIKFDWPSKPSANRDRRFNILQALRNFNSFLDLGICISSETAKKKSMIKQLSHLSKTE